MKNNSKCSECNRSKFNNPPSRNEIYLEEVCVHCNGAEFVVDEDGEKRRCTECFGRGGI